MPRIAKPLTAQKVKSLPPGMHCDGDCLYLHVSTTGARSWVYRYLAAGKRRDYGIGPTRLYTLAQARDKAIDLGRALREGVDPIEARRKQKAAQRPAVIVSFGDVAHSYIEAHKKQWSESTVDAWRSTLRLHVLPKIGKANVADIDTNRVLDVLNPLWEKNAKTAATIRSRIELVLGLATAKGLRSGDNPARWSGHLEFHLASPTKAAKTKNFEAISYAELPAFMVDLRKAGGPKADSIEFAVLTCSRVGEVLGATWPEIDFQNRMWIVPEERMKGRREHRVPLSDAALAVLARQKRRNDTDLIFLSDKGRLMYRGQINEVLTKLRPGITAHGFRSTFRDWAAEKTNVAPELAEMALAHTVGSHVERAYRRTDLIEKRRELATAWAAHCGG